MITKTNYIQYLHCPRSMWLHKKRKDLKPQLTGSEQFRIEQGNQVEALARDLFESGILISTLDLREAEEKTKTAMLSPNVMYQATAIHDGLAARADIMTYNEDESGWDLYEVKSSTELKKEYLDDVTFQKFVFENSGYKIANSYVIYLNKEYVRAGGIDIGQLFTIENVNEQVKEREVSISNLIRSAKAVLDQSSHEEIQCTCTLSTCEYPEQCFGNLPPFSVHKLLSRSKGKLKEMIDQGAVDVNDIPDSFGLSQRQQMYATVHKTNKSYIDQESIEERLSQLKYPLYFLDYETVSIALPPFEGYKPYQHIVFQYSLHVLHESGKLEHFDYIADSGSDDPAKNLLLASLSENIENKGSIIVWNDSFEKKRNEEMAEIYPEHKTFLLAMLNHRIFDLMKIFYDQLYVHPKFYGSYSIKKILPVLIPDLKYEGLDISDGMSASLSWYNTYLEQNEDDPDLARKLKEYCKLDTLAMVEIYKFLKNRLAS